MHADEPPEPVVHAVDVWWTVLVVDRIAVPLVRRADRVNALSPWHLTMVAHGLGLISAGMFATGQIASAAVLFELRFVLDCMDGKLARLRGTTSRAGAYVDFVGDFAVTALAFAGLGVWLHDQGRSAVLAIALPTVFLLHLAVRLQAEAEGPIRRLSDQNASGYTAWMARRRLTPVPSRIDVEHGLLFILALAAWFTDRDDPLHVGAILAVAYFGYVGVRFAWSGWSSARAADRQSPGRISDR